MLTTVTSDCHIIATKVCVITNVPVIPTLFFVSFSFRLVFVCCNGLPLHFFVFVCTRSYVARVDRLYEQAHCMIVYISFLVVAIIFLRFLKITNSLWYVVCRCHVTMDSIM